MQMSVSLESTWIVSCKPPSITFVWCLRYTMLASGVICSVGSSILSKRFSVPAYTCEFPCMLFYLFVFVLLVLIFSKDKTLCLSAKYEFHLSYCLWYLVCCTSHFMKKNCCDLFCALPSFLQHVTKHPLKRQMTWLNSLIVGCGFYLYTKNGIIIKHNIVEEEVFQSEKKSNLCKHHQQSSVSGVTSQ